MRSIIKNNLSSKTNWVAITGAPSSGKTSVIEELERRGFTTQGEVARALIETLLEGGRSISEIRQNSQNIQDLQRKILDLKFARETALDTRKLVFMDRGMPDSITYFRLAGLDTREAERMSRIHEYRAVFIFDRLPVVHDRARTETEAEAEQIGRMLEADYLSLGYNVSRVPVMPVAERADFILKTMGIVGPE